MRLRSRRGDDLTILESHLERFFFAPASDVALHVLRLAIGIILIVQALLISHLVLELWSSMGLMQSSLGDFLTGGDMLWFTGLRTLVTRLGFSEALWLRGLFAAYLGSLVALVMLGTRTAAVASCVLHALLMAGGSLSSYGVDQFSQVALFILVIDPGTGGTSSSARFALRGLQVTLCLAYLGSGLAKARGNDWYTGDAIYRALTLPLYRSIDASFLIQHVWLAKLLAWGTVFLEIGYPVLMFCKRTRVPAVIGVTGMHLGILLFMRLHSFSLVMGMLTGVAFGVSHEPRAVSGSPAPEPAP